MNTQHALFATPISASGSGRQKKRKLAHSLRCGMSFIALVFAGFLALGTSPASADEVIEVHGCGPGKVLWDNGITWDCTWIDIFSIDNIGNRDPLVYHDLTDKYNPWMARLSGPTKDKKKAPKKKSAAQKQAEKGEKNASTLCSMYAMTLEDLQAQGRPSFASYTVPKDKNHKTSETHYTCLRKENVSPTIAGSYDSWSVTYMDKNGSVFKNCFRPLTPEEGQTVQIPPTTTLFTEEGWYCHKVTTSH